MSLRSAKALWSALALVAVATSPGVRAQETAPAPAPATTEPAPAAPPAEPAPAPAVEAPTPYPVDDEKAAIAWLDERLKVHRYVELLPAIQPHVPRESRPELQWRYARILINVYEIKREAPDAEKLKSYAHAERLTRECIAKEPVKVPACYLELGISIGRVATLNGVLKTLRKASEVEDVWEKGLNLSKGKAFTFDGEPLEAHFYYTLGIFYRLVPDWFIVKVIAGTRGDKKKSVAYHRESVKLRPDPSTWLELGVSLICHGQKKDVPADVEEGKTWVQKTIDYKPKNDLDRIDQKNAKKVLADLDLACGYSRDKFQKTEEKDLQK